MSVILASQSPRRQELLQRIFPTFTTLAANIDETVPVGITPKEYVAKMAQQKAQTIAVKHPEALVIGCDTIVALGQEILGKPANAKDGYDMLRKLSGKTHDVHTAVTLIQGERQLSEVVSSKVTFYDLSDAEIKTYLATNEYADKAGAYGIQGQGALLIKEIAGDYYAIMGLPIARLRRMLTQGAGEELGFL
ncbi:Maf family protein [Enterococcus faecalis]